MKPRPQKVAVRAIKDRRKTRPTAKPWIVAWVVDGRERSKAFPSRARADQYRNGLLVALTKGERFDPATGEPVSWAPKPTALTFAREWFDSNWPHWEAGTRRSAREGAILFVETLTAKSIPDELRKGPKGTPGLMRRWLIQVAFAGPRPGACDLTPAECTRVARWVTNHSQELTVLDEEAGAARLRLAAALKDDGTPASANYHNRRRTTLGEIVNAAVRAGHVQRNRLKDKAVRKAKSGGIRPVDSAVIMSPEEARAFLTDLAAVGPASRELARIGEVIRQSGCRPGEAVALRLADCDLPEEEDAWGILRFKESRTVENKRDTDDGKAQATGPLKWRAESAVRPVEVGPALVAVLRHHVAENDITEPEALLFGAKGCHPLTNSSRRWNRVRARRYPPGHPLRKTTLYDLRHTHVTALHDSGHWTDAEIAERVGNTVAVLRATYVNVFHGRDGNGRREALLAALG